SVLAPAPPPISTPFPYTPLFRSLAARHSPSSFTCVPDESPRETNGPPAAAMRRNASAAVAAVATRAGSAAGPTTANRLAASGQRSEEHTSELQSRGHLVCRLLLE